MAECPKHIEKRKIRKAESPKIAKNAMEIVQEIGKTIVQ